MFAVFKTGGKQYKVKSGDILSVEKLVADLGDKVRFNQILALGGNSPSIGTPLVSGACVEAEILNQTKGKKVIHFVKRRRKHSSQRKKGHRQDLTILKVLEIKSDQKIDETSNFEILGKILKQVKSSSNIKETFNQKNTTPKSVKKSEVKPASTKNAEVKPASTKNAEVKPASTKKAEVKPARTKTVQKNNSTKTKIEKSTTGKKSVKASK
ncbi:MAG: 50S ribosomal protein L21 [Paracoccaceae bacterium]